MKKQEEQQEVEVEAEAQQRPVGGGRREARKEASDEVRERREAREDRDREVDL